MEYQHKPLVDRKLYLCWVDLYQPNMMEVFYGESTNLIQITKDWCTLISSFRVSNQFAGSDPAPGHVKRLWICLKDGRHWSFVENTMIIPPFPWSGIDDPPRRWIVIQPYGRTGNNLLEHMLAVYLHSKIPELRIFCTQPNFLALFGLQIPKCPPQTSSMRVVTLNHGNLRLKGGSLSPQVIDQSTIIKISYCFFKREYNSLLNTYRLLYGNRIDVPGFDASYLVINVRLEDIAQPKSTHPNMPIIPFSFHRFLLRTTGLQPVFLGQLDDGVISTHLRIAFPHAIFLPCRGILSDFECLRRSKNLSISVSTFSFLVGYLSNPGTTVHMPVYGGFNPQDRPDGEFLIRDPRFHYYRFPRIIWQASKTQIQEVIADQNIDYESMSV